MKNTNKKRRLVYLDFQSTEILKHIKQTPVQFGGSHHIEVVMFPNLFLYNNFNRKKLNYKQKSQLNYTLFAESELVQELWIYFSKIWKDAQFNQLEETKIDIYNDIPRIINKIKLENRMAKNVHEYILQIPLPAFSLVVISLIPNKEAKTANMILNYIND
ncbi:hypothetical protein C1645_835405 [Glomus cerebriforme]|uniref:Uncharacterized protein n=1 Tax=Glomus cerebriforme TaxID=658196 RepID=A0A397SCG0_9GLOM|nr:hypothetical protein C1645_835405 [Glomus cerebriforme]